MHLTHQKNYPLQGVLNWIRCGGPHVFFLPGSNCGHSPLPAPCAASTPTLDAPPPPPSPALLAGIPSPAWPAIGSAPRSSPRCPVRASQDSAGGDERVLAGLGDAEGGGEGGGVRDLDPRGVGGLAEAIEGEGELDEAAEAGWSLGSQPPPRQAGG